MNDALRPELRQLDPEALKRSYLAALTRARRLEVFAARQGGGPENVQGVGLDDYPLQLVEAHLERAERKLTPQVAPPGKVSRLLITRLRPVRRLLTTRCGLVRILLLRVQEYLSREQRIVSQALVASWRDFLRGYRERQRQVDQRISDYHRDLVDLQNEIQRQHELIRADLENSHALMEEGRQLQLELRAFRDKLREQRQELEGRLRALERRSVAAVPAVATSRNALRTGAMTNDGLDAYYLEFEDRFRGPRTDVRQNLERNYLPALRAAGLGAGAQALDIGCGRGEWLEQLGEWGLQARGVDLNPVMAEYCQAQGLQVTTGDGIAALTATADGSLDLVSVFHVIEHLPFAVLVRLLDQAHRALKPGGLLILETPNPENLIVGSCNFWNDPTHQHPLPPEPTAFLLQTRGYRQVDILRLHPRGEVDASATGALRELMERLYVGQDYALVAHA